MRIAGLNTNDFANGEGTCVSLFVQGCPHHCSGCFNPETWDFKGGEEAPPDLKNKIISAICANDIIRNFSILGGEPLCEENIKGVSNIIQTIKNVFPNIKIFVWTGYTLEELQKREDNYTKNILSNINILIDGPFIEEKKDLTLKLRGSRNQRILYRGVDF